MLSCEKQIGPEGKQALLKFIQEPAGENCKSGGYLITTGVDQNSNGILDNAEVQNSEYICHGNDGRSTLVSVLPETPGDFCTSGGVKITSGIDENFNGLLDSSEVQRVELICNGIDGNIDKQIRIGFGQGYKSYVWDEEEWTNRDAYIYFFNLNNYPEVDSIVFVATAHVRYSPAIGYIELYNHTDNNVIENSRIEYNNTTPELVSTKVNLIDFIPKKTITLGIRMKSSKSGSHVYYTNPFLILYRE